VASYVSERLKHTFTESRDVRRKMIDNADLLQSIERAIEVINNALCERKTVFIAGNGGSAADAQHLTSEFVSRFAFDRPGLPAICLSTDAAIITAIGNDYGFDQIFARQLQALAKPGDIFLGLTTSGQSPNILTALRACASLHVHGVILCGDGGELESLTPHVIRIPSHRTPRIQEGHILVGHSILEEVEARIFRPHKETAP